MQGDIILPELIKTATTNNAFTPNADQWKTITLPILDTLTGTFRNKLLITK
ncbi:MAG: hypothetical protein IPP49_10630 [Saprospiraceae bacterium]|nr:hypothetical protein [Saprospiraceae bacterium]